MPADRILEKLSRVIRLDAIPQWLETHNDVFDCKPSELIGTDREHELDEMIDRLTSGNPC